jgi:NADPH:quinone reductase
MKAMMIRRFGGPEVLQVAELPDPVAGPHEVRIEVHAAGTNPVDTGNRSDGTWAALELPHVLGYDVAGIVDQVGEAVNEVRIGERVMAMTPFPRGAGGYADLVTIDARLVARVPETCSLIEAAAVPLAAGTAYEVLHRLQLASESWILVHGASGGVGTFLVQIASARGMHVIAVAGNRSHGLLLGLGATRCIDYHDEDVAREAVEVAGGPVDAIADLVGGAVLRKSLSAVRPYGQLASIASPDLDIDRIIDENLTFHGVLIAESGNRMRIIAALLGEGTIRPVIAEVFPLERVAEAHRRLETGHSGGKIILQLRPGAG